MQKIKRSSDTTFPALTVCPAFNDAYKENKLESLFFTKDDYKKGIPSTSGLHPWNLSLENVTHDISDLVEEIFIETLDSEYPEIRLVHTFWLRLAHTATVG